MIKNYLILSVLFFFIFANNLFSQDKKFKATCVAFYNVENLFDTIDQPDVNDIEFTPTGSSKWDSKKYWAKIKNMSEVISQIGDEMVKGGPVAIGLAEVENINGLNDLVASDALKKSNYGIVHYDGPDMRGVDVALLYQKKNFKVIDSKSFRLYLPNDSNWRSRDQLWVCGAIDGDTVHIIVNHWPSRRGGEKASAPKRAAAADLTRKIVDSILDVNINAKIIVMGDLNDDPVNKSVTEHLKATGDIKKLDNRMMFNPFYKLYKEGIGSLGYNDAWNLFDQIIVSQGLLGDDKKTFKFHQAKVFNKTFLLQKEGQYKGYPYRTFAGGMYAGGYSDHLPTYIFLIKEK